MVDSRATSWLEVHGGSNGWIQPKFLVCCPTSSKFPLTLKSYHRKYHDRILLPRVYNLSDHLFGHFPQTLPRISKQWYRVSTHGFRVHPWFITLFFRRTLKHAIKYLHNEQGPDGGWVGSWGICFTYAMQFALESLSLVGETYKTSNYSRKACEFLLSHQREDGGWGESYKVQHFSDIRGISLTQCLFLFFVVMRTKRVGWAWKHTSCPDLLGSDGSHVCKLPWSWAHWEGCKTRNVQATTSESLRNWSLLCPEWTILGWVMAPRGYWGCLQQKLRDRLSELQVLLPYLDAGESPSLSRCAQVGINQQWQGKWEWKWVYKWASLRRISYSLFFTLFI